MRDALRLLRTTISAIAAIAISIAVIFSAHLMYRVWSDTGDAAKSVAAPVTAVFDYFRVVRGSQDHRVPVSDTQLDELTVEWAAAAIGRDSEGEHAQHRREVMTLIFDTILRNKERGVSLPDNVRKAHTFFPLAWDHNAHVPWLTRKTTGWVDRDLEKTRRTVPPDILRVAREIVKTRRAPDPGNCAVVIIRAGDTGATGWSGEQAARKWIQENLREDEALKKRGFRTKFFC